ncbi:nucleotide exchange factor GrpE [Streptobacillus moniliformis]|uniref:Protein GrpE n=1 Tax=Streptobacillus moniliformis (strain ATCC 14647 / DSM 12112 / NCTC 10651 / 9901) TaxID=519441 RepID=D1AVP4_STRM9|nr:nucleotide exchange factor GrpE [Streptobacillus moniliformis]ACZ01804.1 GrpE protein [Streptobacillus moniliformis DSM 12112]AVL43202.1 nucleotide exchange factor GrpE [Streptobacillus moniliformis]QXW65130.1 nucleotide exchange factor GrpE [Streptobacillus moniliformis]SQA13000.1 HSP-70 cofactor [Streptobacillus moniliformis]
MSEEIKEEELKETENIEETDVIIEKLNAELEDYKKAYALKLAEFQNFSKRKEKELQEYKEYASKDIILKVLENLDNLERGIEASRSTEDYNKLVEGLEMTIKNFSEMLTNEGVTEIEALEKEYNPYEQHAVQVISNEEKANNEVLMVLQKGYKLKGKVIRPAMVVINKIEEIKNNEEENKN